MPNLASLFFNDEKEAIKQYPELSPLVTLKKQAKRYFSQWVSPDKTDNVVKDCLNRALHDLSRHIPLANADEIKAEALALRSSWIGAQSSVPNLGKLKKHSYPYQGINFMRELLGKNGVRLGWWPYEPDLLEQTDRINAIDNEILKTQWKAAFHTQSKEEVLTQFPMLNVLYNKLDAARCFYSEKMAIPFAEEAAKTLIEPDFESLMHNKPLRAVSEIDSTIHEQLINQIKLKLKIEGKELSLMDSRIPSLNRHLSALIRIQETQVIELEAANELFPQELVEEPIQQIGVEQQFLEEPLPVSLSQETADVISAKEEALDEVIEQAIHSPSSQTIALDSLRSTAPLLPLKALLESGFLSRAITTETTSLQWDIQALTKGLNAQAEVMLTELLGEPIAREKGQLRFGSHKGSLIVTIQGEKQGLWFDHQTGEGGNLLQLIQKEKNLSFKEVLDFAGSYLGHTAKSITQETIDISDVPHLLDEDKQRTLRYARQLANASKPVQGTLGEVYLVATRGIDINVCSDCVRFLPSLKEPETGVSHPALLLIGKNLAGNVQGVQAIFLDKDGKKLACQNPKRSYGLLKGAAVPLSIGGGNLYGLSEGGETGLSVASAFKDMTVFASLGSMTNFSAIDFNANHNTLIIFADHDKPDSEAFFKTNNAADELHRKGFNVLLCKPKELAHDFNQVLRDKGIEGVRQEANGLTLYKPSLESAQLTKSLSLSRQKTKKFDVERGLEC
ncbi:DUF7146 domain-containing protein [Legionella feeleii]|uniref:Conjugative transfer relaxase protein TraI n=1 Tax=Legionella feeleii TaxID=453 RepID=A0A378IVN2_9GAMM|nr:toprim domain-containing protein [Legionella feeleii]STX39287.1 conjugative transfer relaxase protein TraI [Legionella feeleii]